VLFLQIALKNKVNQAVEETTSLLNSVPAITYRRRLGSVEPGWSTATQQSNYWHYASIELLDARISCKPILRQLIL